MKDLMAHPVFELTHPTHAVQAADARQAQEALGIGAQQYGDLVVRDTKRHCPLNPQGAEPVHKGVHGHFGAIVAFAATAENAAVVRHPVARWPLRGAPRRGQARLGLAWGLTRHVTFHVDDTDHERLLISCTSVLTRRLGWRMAKKLELAYIWGVQASHLPAFGLSSISLPSD